MSLMTFSVYSWHIYDMASAIHVRYRTETHTYTHMSTICVYGVQHQVKTTCVSGRKATSLWSKLQILQIAKSLPFASHLNQAIMCLCVYTDTCEPAHMAIVWDGGLENINNEIELYTSNRNTTMRITQIYRITDRSEEEVCSIYLNVALSHFKCVSIDPYIG